MERKLNYQSWDTVHKISYSDFLKKEKFVDAVYVIDFGCFSLDLLLKGFGCINYSQKYRLNNKYCLVVFGGAINNSHMPPFFSGVGIHENTNIPLVSISDPTLYLDDKLSLAWYAGSHETIDLQFSIARMLDNLFEKFNITPILTGGSGGGFAALVFGSLIKTNNVILAWNPQTDITEYHPRHVVNYLKIAFPSVIKLLADFYSLPFLKGKSILKEIFVKLSLIYRVDASYFNSDKNKIIYFQNIHDAFHVNNHLQSFFLNCKMKCCGFNSFTYNANTLVHFGSWGEGHTPPPKNMLISVINGLNKGSSIDVIAKNLYKFSDQKISVEYFSHEKKEYFKDKINYVILKDEYLKFIFVSNDSFCESGVTYAIYFYSGLEKVEMHWYQFSSEFKIPSRDITAVHLFAKDVFGNIVHKYLPFKSK